MDGSEAGGWMARLRVSTDHKTPGERERKAGNGVTRLRRRKNGTVGKRDLRRVALDWLETKSNGYRSTGSVPSELCWRESCSVFSINFSDIVKEKEIERDERND